MSDISEEPVIKVSWLRDLFPIVMLLISGLVWGMKLEARYDKLENQLNDAHGHISALQSEINKGILPITAEKISNLESRTKKLEENCGKHISETQNQ